MDLRRAAREAREALGPAMAALQQDPNPPREIQAMTAHVAEAVGSLFAAEQTKKSPKEGIAQARQHLSRGLKVLQETRLTGPIGTAMTQSVARALSTLYAADGPDALPPLAGRPEALPPAHLLQTEVGFVGDTNFYVGFSGDLTDGGLFVATYDVISIGTTVTVQFTLPDEHKIVARGVVAWARLADEANLEHLPGVGVHLEPLLERDMKSVRSFLQKRAPIFWAE